MAKSKQNTEDILTLSDIIIGTLAFGAISSSARFQSIINDVEFREKYNISGFKIEMDSTYEEGRFNQVYLAKSEIDSNERFYLSNIAEDDDGLISKKPLIVAYTDGGFEYLAEIWGTTTRQPMYKNTLFLPTGLRLHFSHPIKNEKLLEMIKGKR